MISHIDQLLNFGIFKNFVGNETSGVPAFNKFNLIYGWNYSGKTTLSRVFQSLERKGLDREHSSSSFKILQVDEAELNSSNLSQAPTVRVFNRDFVTENFRKEHSAPAVFIVGKENADLKARLAQLQVRRSRVEKIAGGFDSKRSEIDSQVSKAGTDTARNIRDQLGDAKFERPQLLKRIAEVREEPDSHFLVDDAAQSRLATLRSGEHFTELPYISPNLPELTELAHGVNAILSQTASNRAIEQFKLDVILEGWVRQGLALHQDTATCGYCGSPLTESRLETLRGHFSEAYENLLRDLEQKVEQVKGINLKAALHDEMRLMPEPRRKLPEVCRRLNAWLVWAGEVRDQLVSALHQKKGAIETTTVWNGDLTHASEAATIIQEINKVIERHNELVRGIERAKATAKLELERHYAAIHFRENEISHKEEEITRLRKRSEHAKGVRDQIARTIRKIDDEISQSSIGANKLNELLKYLLVDSDIVVESVGNSEFRFLRGGEAAINLSDGEKTAVTLAYFLTSLEANGSSPENAIVFVDDPISSLDSNHIYAVYALIVDRLERCHQLFVSTHNSEFFNLLKGQWLGPKGGNKPESSAYHVCRTIQLDGSSQAEIRDLPNLLRKYKSEYEFVFSHLHTFSEAPAPSAHEAYTAPNLLRKFLEAYLGFRKPCVTDWHKKLDLLFDTPEERREVHKFADDASHLQSLNRCLQEPAYISSSQKCVRNVLRALRDKDPEHAASLEKVVCG